MRVQGRDTAVWNRKAEVLREVGACCSRCEFFLGLERGGEDWSAGAGNAGGVVPVLLLLIFRRYDVAAHSRHGFGAAFFDVLPQLLATLVRRQAECDAGITQLNLQRVQHRGVSLALG